MIAVTERAGGVTFEVRVQPRASRDEVSGEYQGALKIRLTAPAIEDRANEALRSFLAECLNVPRAAVKILSGEKSRTKRVQVQGIAGAQINTLA